MRHPERDHKIDTPPLRDSRRTATVQNETWREFIERGLVARDDAKASAPA